MNRSEAIAEVISNLRRIEGEWGNGGSINDEAAVILMALGVTRDELIAHNVIKDGYYYRCLIELARMVADGALIYEVQKEIVTRMDSGHPIEGQLRRKIAERMTNAQ